MNENEPTFYDLSRDDHQEEYRSHVYAGATSWAEQFTPDSEGGAFEDGDDLWVDLITRFPQDYYDTDIVSDLEEADRIGRAVCAKVVACLPAPTEEEEED